MSENSTSQFFKSTILGHPSGLFVLFFTEIWERFSYYGERALLDMSVLIMLFNKPLKKLMQGVI